MIRALHRWPGLLALVLVTVLALSGAALSVFPMAERLVAPQADGGAERGRSGGAGGRDPSGAGADPPLAFGHDHRLVVRRRHAGVGGDRPGDRGGCRIGRSEPGGALADQPAPVAVSGRCRAAGHGGGRLPPCWCWPCRGRRWWRGARAAGGAGSRACAGRWPGGCMSNWRASRSWALPCRR